MITVHHLHNSRSQRILWLLEELEVPYEVMKYERMPNLFAPQELTTIHPLGKCPVIKDGAIVLCESGAIVEYLIGKYGYGKMVTPPSGELDDVYFKHYAEGSLQPLITRSLVCRIIPEFCPRIFRPLLRWLCHQLDKAFNKPDLEKHAQYLEKRMVNRRGDWLAGGDGPTAADFLMSFALETFHIASPQSLGPCTRRYVSAIQRRPAYQKAIQRGGPYEYTLSTL